MSVPGLAAYRIVRQLTAHFRTRSYDVFESKGRLNGVITGFEKKANKAVFIKLERIFNDEKALGHFVIANYCVGNYNAVWEVTPDDIHVYQVWRKAREAITHQFRTDCSTLLSRARNDIPVVSGNEECILFNSALAGVIRPETVVLLDHYLPFLDQWEDNLHKSVFSEVVLRLRKYKRFVKYNPEKIGPLAEQFIGNLSNINIGLSSNLAII